MTTQTATAEQSNHSSPRHDVGRELPFCPYCSLIGGQRSRSFECWSYRLGELLVYNKSDCSFNQPMITLGNHGQAVALSRLWETIKGKQPHITTSLGIRQSNPSYGLIFESDTGNI